jgi:hypothetical protein
MLLFFKKMFEGTSGKPSAMRLQSVAWTLGILFCIIWVVVKTNAFPSIPEPILYSVPAVMLAKAYQRKNETVQPIP